MAPSIRRVPVPVVLLLFAAAAGCASNGPPPAGDALTSFAELPEEEPRDLRLEFVGAIGCGDPSETNSDRRDPTGWILAFRLRNAGGGDALPGDCLPGTLEVLAVEGPGHPVAYPYEGTVFGGVSGCPVTLAVSGLADGTRRIPRVVLRLRITELLDREEREWEVPGDLGPGSTLSWTFLDHVASVERDEGSTWWSLWRRDGWRTPPPGPVTFQAVLEKGEFRDAAGTPSRGQSERRSTGFSARASDCDGGGVRPVAGFHARIRRAAPTRVLRLTAEDLPLPER